MSVEMCKNTFKSSTELKSPRTERLTTKQSQKINSLEEVLCVFDFWASPTGSECIKNVHFVFVVSTVDLFLAKQDTTGKPEYRQTHSHRLLKWEATALRSEGLCHRFYDLSVSILFFPHDRCYRNTLISTFTALVAIKCPHFWGREKWAWDAFGTQGDL